MLKSESDWPSCREEREGKKVEKENGEAGVLDDGDDRRWMKEREREEGEDG
jgi:hypothetical protein